MALKKTLTLGDVGLNEVQINAYINIMSINIQYRTEGMILTAMLNVFASEQARRENKNALGVETVSGIYDPASPVNIHTAVYNIAKTHAQFADADNA